MIWRYILRFVVFALLAGGLAIYLTYAMGLNSIQGLVLGVGIGFFGSMLFNLVWPV